MITLRDHVDGDTVRSSTLEILVSRTPNGTIVAGDVFDVLDIILATVTLVSILLNAQIRLIQLLSFLAVANLN